MATYKVIQDIEAEDHILGPLSLRQFIFAIIAVLCFYFTYLVVSKHAGFLAAIFLPPGLFAAFFAFPFGKDQPTEIWALAKIRFLFKPRRRIWDQSGVKELVTVTVPKRVEEHRTDGLSQTEVRSRLSALAGTIDSRGWAVKNVNVNLYAQPGVLATGDDTDRLIDVGNMPQEVPSYDVQAADDIMDAQNNPIAHQFDEMINASAQAHRQQITSMLSQPADVQTALPTPATNGAPPADYWFLNQPVAPPQISRDQAIFDNTPVVHPGSIDSPLGAVQPTADEQAVVEKLRAQHERPQAAYSHMKVIQPLDKQKPQPPAAPAEPRKPDPANAQLASNNDLNISTIARVANKQDEPPDNEVVISLH